VLRRPPLRVWVWTAATLALAVVAVLLWRGSDAAATEHTTASAPAVPTGAPAATLARAWTSAANPAPGGVVESGRVILGSTHGIRALDPATGREVWHYTRSNAQLCGETAVDQLVVAVFRTADRCDEAVALHADTGGYRWTRTVNFSRDVTLTSTTGIVLAGDPTGLVTIDPAGDNIRWRYAAPDGCRLAGAVAGTAGVALVQNCAGSAAPQVRLLDGFTGSPHWTADVPVTDGEELALAGADGVVTVVAGDSLRALARADGAVVATVALDPAGDDAAPLAGLAGGDAVVWARGLLCAFDPGSGALLWQQPARGLPLTRTDLDEGGAGTPLFVAEDGAFVQRDPQTGAELGRSAVDGDLPAGGTSEAVGDAVVYSAAGQVLGYR
jgi:outer membrane protein assembly factor BamB